MHAVMSNLTILFFAAEGACFLFFFVCLLLSNTQRCCHIIYNFLTGPAPKPSEIHIQERFPTPTNQFLRKDFWPRSSPPPPPAKHSATPTIAMPLTVSSNSVHTPSHYGSPLGLQILSPFVCYTPMTHWHPPTLSTQRIVRLKLTNDWRNIAYINK